MSISKLLLYYNTLKYLKFKQIGFRIIRAASSLHFTPPYKLSLVIRKFQEPWKQFTALTPSIESEKPLAFTFLNRTKNIEKEEDWNDPAMDKLWLYNLHYHSFILSTSNSSLKKRIIEQWILQNPWPVGVGWEPYPLSLRIVNWIKFSLIEDNKNIENFNQSLFLQCISLEKQIEYHILGNHLFENAKALFFAGLYFNTRESKRWLKKATSILLKQIKEQVLEDGGHFERSPMYHAIILEGILDLYQLILISQKNVEYKLLQPLEQDIKKIIPKMLQWLTSLSHQDGDISFFNDSTFDVAPNPQALYQYAAFLGFPVDLRKDTFIHFQKSGYARAENNEALILADIGSVGPSYLPGHAHAGTLSFEASLKGERLFVNSGISTYNVGEERTYQRSTLAHNTVAVNGMNSSQVWSSFRVAKRAKVFGMDSDVQNSMINFSAVHNGYQRLKYSLIHKREWFLADNKLIVRDFLTGQGTPNIMASFHLHPQWEIVSQKNNELTIKSLKTEQLVKAIFPRESKIQIEEYGYAIGFNKKKKGSRLILCISNKSLPFDFQTEIGW